MKKSIELSEQEVSTLKFILSEYKLQHSAGNPLGILDVSDFKEMDQANQDLPELLEKLS
ncbi:hypothetical protein ACFQ5M_06845 [Agrilactobacillus yilanensis]|uniref:Uncharacterized protein n=1 Tax=Agrilactobacillus yilanensis TaxID=2485997 RepID=A0ABW4J785_9LACO|nr:hypothetical protein [Agrilactobacillus yilanensis]